MIRNDKYGIFAISFVLLKVFWVFSFFYFIATVYILLGINGLSVHEKFVQIQIV
jgi:hypothetical protein